MAKKKEEKTQKPMIQLRIRRSSLVEIAAGRQKIETRTNIPYNTARLCDAIGDSYYFKEADTVRLYVGNGEFCTLQIKKMDMDKAETLYRIHLGKILESNITD